MSRFGFQRSVPPLVALLTDFGTRDHYVGVMKGVILGRCRHAHIVDVSHGITPQDVTEAAFVLSAAYRYFPEGTLFVCVVDPGVGGERGIICMEANGQVFLAPDNGLLGVVANQSRPKAIHSVQKRRYFLPEVSSTFHGRDIFAPVAAHLCSGVEPKDLGPPLAHVRPLSLPRPIKTAGGVLRGEVIYVDQFGNLITNVTEGALQTAFAVPREQIEVRVRGGVVRGIAGSYCDVPEGELVALIGSSGYLEVALNKGSAAAHLGCSRGETVRLAAPGG